MIIAEIPTHEAERLVALLEYDIMDTQPDDAFDDLSRLAACILDMPIALVTLVDKERQWFKSRVGLSACETPRQVAFCAHAILDPWSILEVEDASLDLRFSGNPLVTGTPDIRFYAGAPLVTPHGLALGTLCVIDQKPRRLTEEQRQFLLMLARQVVAQLELHKQNLTLKRLNEQLESANRELEHFSRVAAHDLQEPLRKLITFSDVLQLDLGENLPAEAAASLDMILDASVRMKRLVNDLLELSKVGMSMLQRTRFPLQTCVQAALDALSLCIKEKGAEITWDELPKVYGDPRLVTQLLQNLIGNALKFIDAETPVIQLTASQEKGQPVFGVKDNGIGIEPCFQEQIFEPFKRLHGQDQYGGNGIGLAIAYKAVEKHGGRIWVESALGEGSHFKFTLGL